MRTIKLPSWTNIMPDNAQITTKEILEIFKYSPKTGIFNHIKEGLIPEPDSKFKSDFTGFNGRRTV